MVKINIDWMYKDWINGKGEKVKRMVQVKMKAEKGEEKRTVEEKIETAEEKSELKVKFRRIKGVDKDK